MLTEINDRSDVSARHWLEAPIWEVYQPTSGRITGARKKD